MERKMANRLSRSLEWGGSSDEDEEGEENFCVSDTVYKVCTVLTVSKWLVTNILRGRATKR